MKTSFIIFFVFLHTIMLSAQEITGDWEGALQINAVKLPVIFHISQGSNRLSATIDSPAQGAMNIPIKTVIYEDGKLELKAPNLGIIYNGTLQNDSIKGIFKQAGIEFPLSLVRSQGKKTAPKRPQTPQPPFDYNIEEVSFTNPAEGNTLAGTLCTPKDAANFPVVVMITGSGAQNRDEEIFGHKPFWVLADYLAKRGVGSLRMDDRGVGKSIKGKPDATSKDFATDISSAVDFLTERGLKNIGLLGHSEGGMIAPMVATDNPKVQFLVLMAAPGIPIKELMLQQNYTIGKAQGMPENLLEKAKLQNLKIYDFIINYVKNNFKNDLQNHLIELAKNSTQKPVNEEQLIAKTKQQSRALSSAWFQYFIKFNPKIYLEKIKIPVLAINGSLDVQVDAKSNLKGIETALQKAENKHFTLKEFADLNHLFQKAKTGMVYEYGTIEETINPKVLQAIGDWIETQATP